jgi:L-seryl-tRNA(Ser) seleniumtransferase
MGCAPVRCSFLMTSDGVGLMPSSQQTLLRSIPSVDKLLQDTELQSYADGVPRAIVVHAVRSAVETIREELLAAATTEVTPDRLHARIVEHAQRGIRRASRRHYRKVINATGIILHTGLGRAVLPQRAMQQIQEELSGYSLLQADPGTGSRSRRDDRIEWLLQQLTGAEAATVVNNNAAATMIVLNTLGKNREIIVSRGHLVEIGGSFRLPDIMAASGATLVEVGTTNKTYPHDYENAINENTAAIMRVHPSNYRITGFTAEVSTAELARIAHAYDLPLIDDVGAGALIDFRQFGFEDQPTLIDSVKAGADILTASGDKLIGSAQAGIILGRADLVQRVRKNPLARIVRVDKLTLTALEATLTLFLDESVALSEVPTLRMLQRSLDDLDAQAAQMVASLRTHKLAADFEIIDGVSQMGSGSLPGENLPTRLVSVQPVDMDVVSLAERLRLHSPPVFARIAKERLLIDPRTLLTDEEHTVVEALVAALSSGE